MKRELAAIRVGKEVLTELRDQQGDGETGAEEHRDEDSAPGD